MRGTAKWIWLAFLLPLVVDFVMSRPWEEKPTQPTVELLDALLAEEDVPGHGAFCVAKGHPPVYMGRDNIPVGTYGQFREWCDDRGGKTGWSG